MDSIGVLGAGTWGMALARLLCNKGHEVTVWSAIADEIDDLQKNRVQKNLPAMKIPEEMKFTKCIEEAVKGKNVLLFAVPSPFVRSVAAQAAPYLKEKQMIVDVAKGIEEKTFCTMSEVIEEELEKQGVSGIPVVALSGPTHAEEVAVDMPTTIVAACENLSAAEYIQDVFMTESFRVYTNHDKRGVELGGAIKNVIAFAVGISNGLGYGDNARAALISRGMCEITRLGLAMGCLESTFSGLSGVGDLIVTASSKHSRNNRAGFLVGSGHTVEQAVKEVGMVVEGLHTLPAARQLGQKYSIETPVIDAVDAIVSGAITPAEAAARLMGRDKKTEWIHDLDDIHYEQVLKNKKRGTAMKRVITYGTFDLLHYGHINLLKRAKELGDYLVVCLSTDEFNWNQKQKKCYFSYEKRKALLEAVRYVDLVIPEENWDQKRTDVHEYHIDTFVMGDDWKGKFDFLKEEGVEVVYLPRTPEISTTQIKKDLNKK